MVFLRPENRSFSDAFRGYIIETFTRYRLICFIRNGAAHKFKIKACLIRKYLIYNNIYY